MFKYEVKNYEEFYNCAMHGTPMFIDRKIKNYPIPEVYGVIFSVKEESDFKIIECTMELNRDMPYVDFMKMVLNIKLNENTQVRVFKPEQILDLYSQYSDNSEYSFFVLDDVIERFVEFNNTPHN